MTPGARLAAAIEVFADISARRRPAADTLKDWGLGHRFAGSGDRAGIAGLVYDALRRRASAAWIMGEDTPRAVLLGALRRERGLEADAIARLAESTEPAGLRPLYVRRPDAELAREKNAVLTRQDGHT
jgi:16S rRNA (cytosine967-C5)-methyltransferase